MTLERLVSTFLLGAFIWVARFLLPHAIAERDRLALSSTLLTALVALLAWLWIGESVHACFEDGS